MDKELERKAHRPESLLGRAFEVRAKGQMTRSKGSKCLFRIGWKTPVYFSPTLPAGIC